MWSLGASAVLAIAEDTGSVRRESTNESAKKARFIREDMLIASFFALGI
jgi:hypothetical protein